MVVKGQDVDVWVVFAVDTNGPQVDLPIIFEVCGFTVVVAKGQYVDVYAAFGPISMVLSFSSRVWGFWLHAQCSCQSQGVIRSVDQPV